MMFCSFHFKTYITLVYICIYLYNVFQCLCTHIFSLAACIQAIDGDMRRLRVSYMQQWAQHRVSQGQSASQRDAKQGMAGK